MNLNNKNIGATVEDIQHFFEEAGISKKDILKICLILEDSLIQYQEKFGEDKEFTIHKKSGSALQKLFCV